MIRHKKAIVVETLIKLILSAVSIIVILFFMQQLIKNSDENTAETICRQSILLKIRTAFEVQPSTPIGNPQLARVSAFPVLCKTINKKVEGDKEKVKKQFADMMARCHWMFGNGVQQELFKTIGLSPQTKNDCFVCYVASTKKGFSAIDGTEFVNYLRTQPYKPGNATYLDYIQFSGGPGASMVVGDIKPNDVYAVAFQSQNKEPQPEKAILPALLGAKAGASVGGKVGAFVAPVVVTLLLVPEPIVSKLAAVAIGVAVPVVAAITGAIYGAAVATFTVELGEVARLFTERDVNIIWFGPLDLLQRGDKGEPACSIVKGVE